MEKSLYGVDFLNPIQINKNTFDSWLAQSVFSLTEDQTALRGLMYVPSVCNTVIHNLVEQSRYKLCMLM